jgi:MgtC family
LEPNELFISLGLAIAAGLLIGIERELSASQDPSESFLGGARTHPLVSLTGGLALLVSHQTRGRPVRGDAGGRRGRGAALGPLNVAMCARAAQGGRLPLWRAPVLAF